MALTNIEMQALNAQIEQSKIIYQQLPKITEALERIAAALEQDITKDIATLDEHFRTVIEMQTGITKDGVNTKETSTNE